MFVSGIVQTSGIKIRKQGESSNTGDKVPSKETEHNELDIKGTELA